MQNHSKVHNDAFTVALEVSVELKEFSLTDSFSSTDTAKK